MPIESAASLHTDRKKQTAIVSEMIQKVRESIYAPPFCSSLPQRAVKIIASSDYCHTINLELHTARGSKSGPQRTLRRPVKCALLMACIGSRHYLKVAFDPRESRPG